MADVTTLEHRVRVLRSLVQLYVEVEAGLRPARALAGCATRLLVEALERGARRSLRGTLPEVGGVRFERVGDRLHVAAVTWHGLRAEAVVLELRVVAGRWQLVAIERPTWARR